MYTKITITFTYGTHSGVFYVQETKGGKWQWVALGNTGEEDTMNKAIAAGRNWVRFDINKQGD